MAVPYGDVPEEWVPSPQVDNRVDTMSDRSDLLEMLEGRRQELSAELGRLTAPPEQGASVGFGKRIGDGTSEAVERLATTAMARSIHASLVNVDRAIAKLGEGTYGICDVCGEAISGDRLEALPTSSSCVKCASAR